MALDLEPVPEEGDAPKLDLQPVEEEAGAVSKFLNKRLPGASQLADAGHSAAEGLQHGADTIGEEVGKATGSTTLGAITGAPSALAATGTEFLSRMVPTTPKDIAVMAVTEGLGRTGAAGLKLLQEPVINKEMSPIAQRAVAAAGELNIPLTLAQIKNSKSWSMVEKMLGRIPIATDTMNAFYQKQSEALTAAKTDLLGKLGPVGSDAGLGRKVISEAGAKVAKQEGERAAQYATEKGAIMPGKDVPELPEARGAAMVKAKDARQDVAKAIRKSLYKWAEDALPDKATVRLAQTPISEAMEQIVSKYPQGAPQRIMRNKISSIIGNGDPILRDLGTQVEALKSGSAIQGMAPEMVALAKAKPVVMASLPPAQQAAIKSSMALEGVTGSISDMVAALKKNPAALKALPPAMQEAVMNHGSYSFDQLENVVKRLGDEAQDQRHTKLPGSTDYKEEGKDFLKLKDAANGIRDDYFASKGGEAAQRHEIARAFHADYATTFRSKEVQALYTKDPVKVFQAAVKSGRPEAVEMLSKALGPNGTTILKRQLFDDVFSVDGSIPKKVDVLQRMSNYGSALRVLFTPAEQQQWKDFALAGEAPRFLQTEYEKAVRSLILHAPQEIPEHVLNGDVLTARAIKRYVSPEVFKGFGAKLAEKIITPTGTAEAGTSGILTRLNRYEDSYLQTFFDDKTIRGMKMIGEASRILPGYGDLANRPVNGQDAALMYGAMGAMIAPTRMMKMMGPLMIGSNALAKMYTTEEGQRILTTLMRMPETDPRLPVILTRIAAMGYLSHLPNQERSQP